MNKQKLIVTSLLILGALLVITNSVVFASDLYKGMMQSDPENSENDEETPFWGQMHGQGRRWAFGKEFQPMKSELVEAVADVTGLTVDEIESRLNNGERLLNIAIDAGMAEEEYFDLMLALRQEFIDKALEDGVINEDQYNRMQGRLNAVQDGDGFGACEPRNNRLSPMDGYGRGRGRGRW